MAEATFGYRQNRANRHTRSKEESAVLQWSNSQMLRFARAADLRAELVVVDERADPIEGGRAAAAPFLRPTAS